MWRIGLICQCVTFYVSWRNRRVPVLQSLLRWIPSHLLLVIEKFAHSHSTHESPDISSPIPDKQRRPSLLHPQFKIPRVEWANVLHRIEQGEPLRQIAKSYDVSYESVRRVIRAARREATEN